MQGVVLKTQADDRARADLAVRCHNRNRKKGPPNKPVSTPTGKGPYVSVDAERDTASAIASRAAPKAVATGSSLRVSLPTIKRATCGQMSPTNPIGPLTATAAAVMSEATISTIQRSR